MPGVRIGKGARIRHTIIDADVQIPADFQAGWDLEHDRRHYLVSPQGVVVIHETPAAKKPIAANCIAEKTVAGVHRIAFDGARNVA
jgi:ADP-glucose pyrophosphorylase